MIPLLPFAAGLLAGGLAIRLWRNEDARAGVKQALDALGRTARTNLSAIAAAPRTTGRAAPEVDAGGKKPSAKPAAGKKQAAPRRKKTPPAAAHKRAGKGKIAQS